MNPIGTNQKNLKTPINASVQFFIGIGRNIKNMQIKVSKNGIIIIVFYILHCQLS
jgi:hypothetical protein